MSGFGMEGTAETLGKDSMGGDPQHRCLEEFLGRKDQEFETWGRRDTVICEGEFRVAHLENIFISGP